MRPLRALLICIWMLFSLTATAVPAMARDLSCHMEHMEMTGQQIPHHKPDTPTPKTVMPCCSQPVLAADNRPMTLLSRPLEIACLIPSVAAPLRDVPVCLEPRPPK